MTFSPESSDSNSKFTVFCMIVFVMLSAAGRRDIWSGPSAVADDSSFTRSTTLASFSLIEVLELNISLL